MRNCLIKTYCEPWRCENEGRGRRAPWGLLHCPYPSRRFQASGRPLSNLPSRSTWLGLVRGSMCRVCHHSQVVQRLPIRGAKGLRSWDVALSVASISSSCSLLPAWQLAPKWIFAWSLPWWLETGILVRTACSYAFLGEAVVRVENWCNAGAEASSDGWTDGS